MEIGQRREEDIGFVGRVGDIIGLNQTHALNEDTCN